jgi:hypothetical protein
VDKVREAYRWANKTVKTSVNATVDWILGDDKKGGIGGTLGHTARYGGMTALVESRRAPAVRVSGGGSRTTNTRVDMGGRHDSTGEPHEREPAGAPADV